MFLRLPFGLFVSLDAGRNKWSLLDEWLVEEGTGKALFDKLERQYLGNSSIKVRMQYLIRTDQDMVAVFKAR